MIARLRALPVPTPAILGAVLVLSVFFNEGVSPFGAARSVVIAAVIGAVVWLLLWALLRNPNVAALAGALVVLALWNTPDWWRYLIAAAIVAAAPFVLTRVADRIPRFAGRRVPWRALALAATVYSLALLITPVLGWISWGGPAMFVADLHQGGGLDRLASAPAPAADASNGTPAGTLPDIYLILLDEHTRQDTLLRDFGVDDSAFITALEARGFDVSSGSHTNYDSTEWTISSMFQMQYLDALPSIEAQRARGQPIDSIMRGLENDNPVFEALRQKGYTVVTTAPWFEHTIIRRSDVLVDSGLMNEFESQLLLSTTIGRIIDQVLPSWLGDQFRGNVEANMAAASQIASTPSAAPRLAFIHVAAPHEPYVYAADGSPVPLALTDLYGPYAGTPEQLAAKRAAYGDEIQWVDQQAIGMVDAIIKAEKRPAAIIVFGDHGSRLPVAASGYGDSARVTNLFAALTPGHAGLFGSSPTLVNVFPTLLDTYLGESVPMQPNRSYDYYPDEVEVPLPSP